MAERSISYGIGLSDQMVNQMLQSDDPTIVAKAQEYVNTAKQQQAEKPNILNRIGNFFGMSSAGAAEPNNMTMPNVGTGFNTVLDQSGNIQIVPVESNNDFPFVSMAEFAKNNNIISPASVVPNTQSGFATNFPLQPVPVNTGITQTNAASQFEEPFQIINGQKVYISDIIGTKQAEEKANVFQPQQGILSQAKDFITQQLPKTVKGGLDTLINFIPGMRFIRGLDKFDTLPYMDRKFIKSTMDQKNLGTGIYVDPSSGAIKDATGKNVRSLLGNYAETVDREYNRYEKAINRAKDKYNVGFDGTKFTGANADVANQMNKFNLNAFNFYKNQKENKAAQQRQLLDKVAKQVAAGQTAQIGQSLHGGGDGGSGSSFDSKTGGTFGSSVNDPGRFSDYS
tara:strand:- start:39 stop:1229 length:1191 start_codon:yes stop_codon:yes gene_type:complete